MKSQISDIINGMRRANKETYRKQTQALGDVLTKIKTVEKGCKVTKRAPVSPEEAAKRAAGLLRPVQLSAELCSFLNVPSGTKLPRTEVVKRIAEYVRSNGIADPSDGRWFVLNKSPSGASLADLLGNPPERQGYFTLNKYLNRHLTSLPGPSANEKPTREVRSNRPPVDDDLSAADSSLL
jgi:chromatin remodeling complex protein RSC6